MSITSSGVFIRFLLRVQSHLEILPSDMKVMEQHQEIMEVKKQNPGIHGVVADLIHVESVMRRQLRQRLEVQFKISLPIPSRQQST